MVAGAAPPAAAPLQTTLRWLHTPIGLASTDMEPEPELADDVWSGATKTFDGALLKEWEHKLPVEVFISDTDSYAIIYHTVYHKYFERARVEFLGVRELVRLRHEDGVALRELETRHIRFFDSGLLGDLCTVVTKLVELDASRIVMEHRFMRDRDQKMLTRGVCELGFLDVATGAPVPVPPSLLRGLAADPAQHIPRNAISSVFGGGAPVPAAAVRACCLPLPFARASARHAQSNEDNTPGLKNRFRTQRKLLRTQQEI
jgi:YbgC/YbaW family acyl-CoA thioester hydrolase